MRGGTAWFPALILHEIQIQMLKSPPISRLSGLEKLNNNQALRAVDRGRAGKYTLEGRSRGAFSGGEIQRLRRLRQEGHTPTVLVAVSDEFTTALPQSAQGEPPGASPVHSPQSRPVSHIPWLTKTFQVAPKRNTRSNIFFLVHPG